MYHNRSGAFITFRVAARPRPGRWLAQTSCSSA